MELAIDKRTSTAIFVVIALYICCSHVYSMGEYMGMGGSDEFWKAFDKCNDRIFAIGLLSIASFCFTDLRTRLLCYASMFYVAIRCLLEVIYIYDKFGDYDVYWTLSGLYCVFVMFAYTITSFYGSIFRKS